MSKDQETCLEIRNAAVAIRRMDAASQHHAPEFLGRESIFHVWMALAAGVRA